MLARLVALLLVAFDVFALLLFALDHIQLDAVGWELTPVAKAAYRIIVPLAVVIDLLAAVLLWRCG